MTVGAGLDRLLLRKVGDLAQIGKRIVFAQEGDDRAAIPPFADDGGRDAGDILGDAETVVQKFGRVRGDRTRLAIAGLGRRPDSVGQGAETSLLRLDVRPDGVLVHGVSSRVIIVGV